MLRGLRLLRFGGAGVCRRPQCACAACRICLPASRQASKYGSLPRYCPQGNTRGLPRYVLPAFGWCEHTRGFARLCSRCAASIRRAFFFRYFAHLKTAGSLIADDGSLQTADCSNSKNGIKKKHSSFLCACVGTANCRNPAWIIHRSCAYADKRRSSYAGN